MKEHRIPKTRNTFAKRQREQDQRQRTENKRLKRERKSNSGGAAEAVTDKSPGEGKQVDKT